MSKQLAFILMHAKKPIFTTMPTRQSQLRPHARNGFDNALDKYVVTLSKLKK